MALSLAQGLKNVFTDEKYSDLTVTCDGKTFKVHRSVVCTQSDFLRKACDGEFAEAKAGKITLNEDDRHIISTLLHYFYHFDFDDTHHEDHGVTPMTLNLRVAMAADKYFVQPLLVLALDKLEGRVKSGWNTPALADAVTLAYSTENAHAKRLRSILVGIARDHADVLFSGNDNQSPFQKAAHDSPQFLLDYAKSVSTLTIGKRITEKPVDGVWFRCPGESCKKYGVTFRLRTTAIPKNWVLNCPFKCNMMQPMSFWKQHIVAEDKSEASQEGKEG